LKPLIAISGASSPIGIELLNQFEALEMNYLKISYVKAGQNTLYADISELETAASVFSGIKPDVVIHLAQKSINSYLNNQYEYVNQNWRFCSELAKNAAIAGARIFIFASSSAVYGDQSYIPSAESSEVIPSSPYSKMKLKCEAELRKVSEKYEMDTITLRIFNVYGPGMSNSLINKLISLENEDVISLRGPQNFVRDYIHVSDVASSIVEIVNSYQVFPSILNVGTGVGVSNQDLIELIANQIPNRISIMAGPRSYSVADTGLSSKFLPPPKRSLFEYILNSIER
jgi:nucleoside-diphosphate-sugar epimerase